MRDYELTIIFRPDIPEEQSEATINRISEMITTRGGTVDETNIWGRRRLAYPIKHFNEGIYVLWRMKLDPAQVKGLDNQLRISEDVIRHLPVLV